MANHWFITPETDALIQSLSPITQSYASVRTMGYSMGGYAAFRFARDLSAEAAIAVSPQATIDPSTVPFDRRYRREGKSFDARKGHLGQAASDSLEGLIAVDPFRGMDMVHARMILTHFPSVRLARLPFGGHPATKALAGVNRGVILQEIAMADRVAAESLVLAHRRSRIESIDYWKELGAWADRKRPALAEAAGVALSALRGRRAEMRRAAKSG